MKITMYEVNFGEAIVYEDGNELLLVDCSAYFRDNSNACAGMVAYNKVKNILNKDKVKKLMITHFDRDHFNGVNEMRKERFGEIYLPYYTWSKQKGIYFTGDIFEETIKVWICSFLLKKDEKISQIKKLFCSLINLVSDVNNIKCVKANNNISVGTNVFNVLWPTDNGNYYKINRDYYAKLLGIVNEKYGRNLEENIMGFCSLLLKYYLVLRDNNERNKEGVLEGLAREINIGYIQLEELVESNSIQLKAKDKRRVNSINSTLIKSMNDCSIVMHIENKVLALGDISSKIFNVIRKNSKFNCDIYINTSGYVTNDIYVKDGNIDIVNDSNITIEDESIQQVGLYMELSEHKLLIDNSTVNIKGSNSSMVVAICCGDSNMVVSNNSEIIINISGLTACGVSVNAIEKIDNSVVDIDIKKSIADSSAFGISTINDIAINNSDVYIDIIKDDFISNDESGCAYGIAVAKGQINITGTKDKGIEINITGGNGFGIISGYYFEFYPYNDERVGVNISGSNVNVITNIIGTEGSMSAIKVVKGDISLTDSNVNASCSKEAENGYGLQVDNDKIVSIKGGSTTIKGGKMAVNASSITLNNGDYYDTKVMKACTDFEGTDANTVVYDSANITNYKYLEIKAVDSYYYRFDGSSLYKVLKNNSVLGPLDSITWPYGLSVDENNQLVLNGFEFATTANKVLDIVGEATIDVVGENKLCSVYNAGTEYYGIYGNNNLTFIGAGTINIVAYNEEYQSNNDVVYKGIYSDEDITINDGTYFIVAKEYKFYGINGKNMSIKDAKLFIKGEVMFSGAGIYLSNYSGVVKNIELNNVELEIDIIAYNKTENYVNGIYGENCDEDGNDLSGCIGINQCGIIMNLIGRSVTAMYCGYNYLNVDNSNIEIKAVVSDDIILYGFAPEANGIVALCEDGYIKINGGKLDIDVDNKKQYVGYGIYSEGYLELKSANVISKNNGTSKVSYIDSNLMCYSYAIGAEGDMKIVDSEIEAIETWNLGEGYGIYVLEGSTLDVTNSNVIAKGMKGAIGEEGIVCNVKGKVDASTTYDGTLDNVIDFNQNYGNYQYISIIPSVISVDITWGNMDFTYTEGSWNPISHDYNVGTWKPTDGNIDSTKITVNNANSNVPIYAEIGYASSSSNYDGIVGKIVDGTKNVINNKNRILVGDSLAAYLDLDNKLPSTTAANTPIGQVTVTISE